jgi:DUF917 family protein
MNLKSRKKTIAPSFPAMESPASYRIEVLGRLDSSWSERLAGMEITTMGGSGVVPRTILQGQVIDQSALAGVLNTLCDLGLPLIGAAYLPRDNNNKD